MCKGFASGSKGTLGLTNARHPCVSERWVVKGSETHMSAVYVYSFRDKVIAMPSLCEDARSLSTQMVGILGKRLDGERAKLLRICTPRTCAWLPYNQVPVRARTW